MTRPRRKQPIPAALDGGAMEQLSPTDGLRIRLVADDAGVRDALKLVADAHSRVRAARTRAALSPEGAQARALAVKAHEACVREVLEPAVEAAERRRALLVAATPPDHAALAAKVVRHVDGDRLLALDALLRRNPNWRDPALWTAPEVRRYLSRAVTSEARWQGRKRDARERDLPREADWWRSADGREVQGRVRTPSRMRGDQRRSVVERRMERREARAELARLAREYAAPDAVRRALRVYLAGGLSTAEALRGAGVPRSVFENWRDRCRRGAAAGLTKAASNRGGRGDV